jgi:hypothetical protein
MTKFDRSNIQKLDHLMSRDDVSLQRLKVCYSCRKGFCKRKGRAKAAPVANMPGRYVCQKCADAIVSGKHSARLSLVQ